MGNKVSKVNHDPNVNSYYFMGSLLMDVFLKVILTDMLFVLCSVLLVAAIGADDIFVFMDAYKQSAFMENVLDSFEKRMDYVYRRSGLAMAITSATTCTAFLCTLITPIPVVKAF